ncbi:MAG: ABC transporter ATP-binding protein [Thiobacillaceae bacterium]
MPIIEVDHLTKEYRLGTLQGLKQKLVNTTARLTGKPTEERPLFKALDDVSFSIEQGEVVGIIGHNGAGKSTLLKMLARISTPTRGKVRVDGRIAPLIEVGAGFVPDFTGRENVYLNGAILGMPRKEIDKKFDEIVDFAEMAEFIDTPVKRYSSGMQVKLAFAVATSIEAEILIVDEVLAVGDLAFQRKCFDRTEDLIMQQGRTVLIVSHNIRQIERMCKRVMLLEHGRIVADDNPKVVCDEFYARSQSKIAETSTLAKAHRGRYESTGEVEVLGLSVEDESGRIVDQVRTGSAFSIRIRLRCHVNLANVMIGLGIHTTDFVYLTTHSSEISESTIGLGVGDHDIYLRIVHFPLLPGVYMWRMGITCGETNRPAFYGENLLQVSVIAPEQARVPASMRDGFFALEGHWDFGALATNDSHQHSIGATVSS